MALPGKSLKCHMWAVSRYVLHDTISHFECFFFFSPPHVKSEPEDNFYNSPKTLKRERDDDNE